MGYGHSLERVVCVAVLRRSLPLPISHVQAKLEAFSGERKPYKPFK